MLSASLITKNEEELLPACLKSLKPFVDEIVIYDTGSTDATVEIAREAGATVIEGYWDDDFARARNASLDACRGQWALCVNADETAFGSPEALRTAISRTPGETLVFGARTLERKAILSANLFLRTRKRWAGAVHEITWPLDHQPLDVVKGFMVRKHRSSRDPASLERNLACALRGIERSDTSPFPGWVHLAAALSAATLTRLDEAESWLAEGLRLADGHSADAREMSKYVARLIRAEIKIHAETETSSVVR